jgi:hypothetical protein
MSKIQQRKYYRLYTGTNQEEGYDKIHLGYEAKTTEIIFAKDNATTFHVPFFASPQPLNESTLGSDGAFSGPIPALADRIYKKIGNYGNSTPWGTPTGNKDGVWLCSWYYSVSSEEPQWLDRYYNPGRLAYEEALEGRANFTDYIKNDPLYYDIPSALILEPGVMYQYYHHGENSIKNIVNTFSGNKNDRLKLYIDDWENYSDKSLYQNKIVIDNFKPEWSIDLKDPGYIDRSILSFNNTDFINSRVLYNQNYNFENEFSLSFWVNNENWSNATSTQLVGNLQKGGYGVFYNNLDYNPYFVIPETTYGHLFYSNLEGNIYNDKNIQYKIGTSISPKFIGINSNIETVTINTTNSQIIKYNHLGDTIAIGQDNGSIVTLQGIPIQFLIDGLDSNLVLTTSALYIFDKDLNLISENFEKFGQMHECMAFNTNGDLVRELSCIDITFDNFNNKWTIIKTNNISRVYKNNNLFTEITNLSCEKVITDPESNIWILASPNTIYKINPISNTILETYEIGLSNSNVFGKKNIGFIKYYNRSANNYTWYSYIYHSFDKTLYQTTLDGRIVRTTFIPQKLNILDPATAIQDTNLLAFDSKGDFTGYDRRRIFNNVLYNNQKQLQIKLAVKLPSRNLPPSIYTLSVPVTYFQNKVWHLITLTFKNQRANLYIDNYLRDTIELPGNVDVNYDFKNDLIIGCPCGKNDNLNKEINTSSIIWNGYIDTIRIYDYAIDPIFIKYLALEKTLTSDITWNIPTTNIQYVEEIDRFFKHRLPGFKSQFFKINISGVQAQTLETRKQIERDILNAVNSVKPGYTEPLQVEWID